MVNRIKGFWKIKENTNSIFTLFDSLYNLIYKWKQCQMGRWFFSKAILIFMQYLKNFKEGWNSIIHDFFKNLWENTQYRNRSVIIKQHWIITFVQGDDICNFQLTGENSLGKRQIANMGQIRVSEDIFRDMESMLSNPVAVSFNAFINVLISFSVTGSKYLDSINRFPM